MSATELMELLTGYAGSYRGEGLNHEEQSFEGELEVRAVVGGRGATLSYSATGPTGVIYHAEHSLIGLDEQGSLALWPVMVQLPAVLPHQLVSSSEGASGRRTLVFRHGDPAQEEVFRQELTLDLWPNGDVSYRHAWGLPLGIYKERSSARMGRRP
jgi:hypothetical protein